MMSYFQKIAVLAGILILGALPSIGKAPIGESPESLIKSFLYALYQTNQDALAVAKNYVRLDSTPNERSVDVRYQAAANHITMLRQGKSVGESMNSNKPIVFIPTVHRILPYTQIDSAIRLAVPLNDDQKSNVFVLVENGKPLRYFFIQDNKISSFDYMMKGSGGPVYFISY
jgi:hypothetical protein